MGIIMIKQLDNNLYTFEIPLPGSPLKWINTYVIKGNPGEKNLLVDTGFNRPECLQALLKGMAELHINPQQTDVFLTHCHSDHTGNAPALAKLGCQIFMGATAHQLQLRNTWPIKHKRALKEGVSPSVLKRMFVSNPAIMYAPEHYDAIELQEGDKLKYGGYNLRCISTPGHTPGHMCLYDEEKKSITQTGWLLQSKYWENGQVEMLLSKDLEPYPYLSYEQGDTNSFYFSEEILSTMERKQHIEISDRATIFNLMVGLDGYTISSGIISSELNDEKIIAIPLKIEDTMILGYLKHKKMALSPMATEYLVLLKQHIENYGFTIL